MTTVELERIARSQVPPVGATMAVATVDVTPGGRLSNGYPSGLGVRTTYGVAWLVEGRIRTRPFATFPRGEEAYRLVALINGTERRAPRSAPDPVAALGAVQREQARSEASTAWDASSSPVAVPPAVPEPATCRWCRGPIPPGSRRHRVTCSGACRVAIARASNPDRAQARSAAQSANARARALGIAGRLTAEDVLALWEINPACVECGDGRGVDHVSPLSAGGANSPANLQNLCHSCNSRKASAERVARRRPATDPARVDADSGVTLSSPQRPSSADPTSTPQPAVLETGVATQLPIAFGS